MKSGGNLRHTIGQFVGIFVGVIAGSTLIRLFLGSNSRHVPTHEYQVSNSENNNVEGIDSLRNKKLT